MGALGIFDSGIGGLSVLKALRATLPCEDFIYIADSGHAPYGERDTAHVVARSRAVATYLVGQNVKAMVVACNTATAAAVDVLRAGFPALPVVGIEPALKPAAALSRTGHIGVMATRGTLKSSRFAALLARQPAHLRFTIQPCDGLAVAIERRMQSGVDFALLALCARHIAAMGNFGSGPGQIDTLVLGCTHYPFAADLLRTLVGQHVQLLDPGEAVARQTQRVLGVAVSATQPVPQAATGHIEFFTTGEPTALDAAALHWLGEPAASRLLLI